MIRKFNDSLFTKIFIITAILLLCVSLSVFGLVAVLMPQTYSNELNSVLSRQALDFIDELEMTALEDSGGLFDQFLENINIFSVELYDDNGQGVTIPTMRGNETSASEMASSSDAPVLSNSFYFSFFGSGTKYMLVVYGEATQVEELRQVFLRIFPIVFIAALILALLVSLLFSRIITSPVLRISSIATKMSEMQLDWKLDTKRTDELGILEKSLNTMSQNLQTALSDLKNANAKLEEDIEHEKELEQAQMDFFSAASHELKTPITIIKGQLEGMLLGIGIYKDREKYLSRSLEVANTLEVMVQELLIISRLQTSGADLKKEPFDCVQVIQKYLRETEDLIINKDLRVYLNAPQSATVNGNRLLLEKVFSNIIGNAIKYSPQDAVINITVNHQQNQYLFQIENSGTHITRENMDKIFEPFYRIEQSRSRKTGGSGLGLYIVQKILQYHNSVCDVCNTEKGVCFSFGLL